MLDRACKTSSDQPDGALKLPLPLFAVFAVLPMLTACGGSAVSDHIGQQARSTGVVDMSKAADFAWTQVRVYTPYTTEKAVCTDLGELAPDCRERVTTVVPESEYLLVFIDEGKKSAQYVPHARRNGHFLASTGVLSLPRDAAVLEVRPASPAQGNAIYLQPRAQVQP
ncbi:hypothetical protein D3C71_705170 [compost metagenome]|jgi:hypothetical protein